MYSSDAVKYTQLRFQPDGVFQKTMKTMDKAARLAMLPDCDIFCVDLKEGNMTYNVVMHLSKKIHKVMCSNTKCFFRVGWRKHAQVLFY